MNKLQAIFKVDERAKRRPGRELLALWLYCLFVKPSQLRYMPRWLRSRRPGASPIADRMPWFTYDGIAQLERILQPGFKVFEYGSGGSTIFLAPRVSQLVSVEHDPGWTKTVKQAIEQHSISNVTYLVKPPTKSQSKHEYFRSTKEKDASFKDYVSAISDYPDRSFDIVIVDGRARVPCVREAFAKVKPGGYIILDNSERPDYHEAFLFMRRRSSKTINCFGLIAYGTSLMQTTFWKIKQNLEDELGY